MLQPGLNTTNTSFVCVARPRHQYGDGIIPSGRLSPSMLLKQRRRWRKQVWTRDVQGSSQAGNLTGDQRALRESSCGSRNQSSIFGVTDQLDLQGNAWGRTLGTSCLKHNGDDGGGMRCSSGGVKWKVNGRFFLPSTIQPLMAGGCSLSRLLCVVCKY